MDLFGPTLTFFLEVLGLAGATFFEGVDFFEAWALGFDVFEGVEATVRVLERNLLNKALQSPSYGH